MKKNKKHTSETPYLAYANGGFFDGVANYGRSMADIGLSTLGLSNVVPDDAYTGNSANTFRNISGVVGGITSKALPMAASLVGGPMASMAVGAGQQLLGGINNQINQPQFGKGGTQDFYNNWSKDRFVNPAAPIVYPMGGVHPGLANAEIEKQEVVRYPNGGTEQADGPSHDNGGVPVNLPGGTEIFSDRLKASTGKTFAKEAEKFKNNKWDKILEDENNHDPLRTKTANMMKDKNNKQLDKLFAEQESQKQVKASKAFNRFMAKHGGRMPMFWDGGVQSEKDFYNQANKGYYIPDTFGNYMPQKSMMAFDNNAPSQNDIFTQDNINANANNITNNTQAFINSQPKTNLAGVKMNNPNQQIYSVQENSSTGTMGPNNPFKSNNPLDQWYANNGKSNDGLGYTTNNPTSQPSGFDKNAAMMAGIGLLGNTLGASRYLGKYGNRYDKVNYGSVAPKYLDPTRNLADIDRSSYGTQKAIPGATGGHGGQALNYLIANTANRDEMKAKVYQDFENANAGIYNQFTQYNKGLQMKSMEDEAANKGRMISNDNAAWDKIGTSVNQGVRDYMGYRNDNQMIDNYGTLFPDYGIDKNRQFYYRKSR